VATLQSLFDKHDLKATEDKRRDHIERPPTVATTCKDSMRAEIENSEV